MVDVIETNDAPDTLNNTYTIQPGDRFLGSIDPAGDADIIQTTLSVGFGYYVTMSGAGTANSLFGNALELLDQDGTRVAISPRDTTSTTLAVTPTEDADYYIVADPFQSTQEGDYIVSLTQEVSNNIFSTNVTITEGETVVGAIDYGQDVDAFRVNLEAGYGYYVELTGDGSATSLPAGSLRLFDDTGTRVALNGGSDETVAGMGFSPVADDTFFITVDPNNTETTGSYALTVTREVAANFGTAFDLIFGFDQIGRYEYVGDVDMFRTSLNEGVQYSIFHAGTAQADSAPGGVVSIFDAQGTLIGVQTGTGAFQVDFVPETSGIHFISFSSIESIFDDTSGTYSFRIEAGDLQNTDLDDVITGGDANEAISGNAGNDALSGRAGDDALSGDAGNDTLDGGLGDDTLDGGADVDTAFYSGSQTSYTLTLTPTTSTLEDRRGDGNGTDTLTNIEFLDFDNDLFDTPFNLQAFGGPAGLSAADLQSFIELYIAYFNRAPDAVGLNFWGTAFANGTPLDEIAALFIDQDETRATYPAGQTNLEFATAVYNNVLGRTPDDAGLNFWVGELDSGRTGQATFILAVLEGAKADPQPGLGQDFIDQQLIDQQYLSDKTDLGAYFSVIKGMSDVQNATQALNLFTGTQSSITDAVSQIDQYFAAATDANSGEFLMPIVGVLADPFFA